MIAPGMNLTITMTKLQVKTRIMHYRNLSIQIFWHYNRQRKTGPKAADHAGAQGTWFSILTFFSCKVICSDHFIVEFIEFFFQMKMQFWQF